jgi:hypothetical protein
MYLHPHSFMHKLLFALPCFCTLQQHLITIVAWCLELAFLLLHLLFDWQFLVAANHERWHCFIVSGDSFCMTYIRRVLSLIKQLHILPVQGPTLYEFWKNGLL